MAAVRGSPLKSVEMRGMADTPPETILAPSWYCNGFPKAGLHLVKSMLQPFARMMPARRYAKLGTMISSFAYHAWTNDWHNVRYVTYALCQTRPGYYHFGHCGYNTEISAILDYAGLAMTFIYRDLRDVAVSQTHHILSKREQDRHLDKAAYRRLGGFNEALSAVITGLQVDDSKYGPVYYPGVMERWELYAPWLDQDWVCSVRYKDARLHPAETAQRIVEYGMKRLAGCMEVAPPKIDDKTMDRVVTAMVASGQDTKKSPTFRKGLVGGWRDVFTPEHVRLFQETDPDNWLKRLDFEDW